MDMVIDEDMHRKAIEGLSSHALKCIVWDLRNVSWGHLKERRRVARLILEERKNSNE
jgi:hypothetical protein